jgi:hypothetical protein
MRFPASLGTTSVYLPCKSILNDPTARQLLVCDSLDKALRTYLEYLPTLPGGVGRTSR